jgi:EAL domain-containing protein (putative c-di-GMP-specific phosphodiesterase class I)
MSIDEESLGIVETVITLATKLKMDVVAEGIETREQWEKLNAFQCKYGQGFLFSKPLPTADAAKLLDEERAQQPTPTLAEHAPTRTEVELLNETYSM